MIDHKTHWLIGELINDMPIEIDNSVNAVMEYLEKPYYQSKRDRLNEWNPDKGEIFELVMTLWRITLEDSQTYQALIGMVVHKIDCKLELDRAKCAADVIGICFNKELLTMDRKYEGYVIGTEFTIDKEFPEVDRHQILFDKPSLKTTNQLLGGRLKYHSGFTCLNHLNKMNQIPLSLNCELLDIIKEEAPNVLDTEEKKEQWDTFVTESYAKYMQAKGKEFYLEWSADLRGRCYSQGYHINPQGSSFKKAICQLAKREVLRDA
jgi:hypothetical protein